MNAARQPATILYMNHTAPVSGAERVLQDLLRDLDRTQFRPVLACPEGPLQGACAALNVPVITLPSINSRFSSNPIKLARSIVSSLSSVLGYRRAILQTSPALIHANTIRAALITTFANIGTGIPVLWHLHDMLPRNVLGKLIRRMAYRNRRISAIAVSHASERSFRDDDAEKQIRHLPITVIHNSVDTERFAPDAAARDRLRAELQLAPDEVAVAILGQITPRKRQLELVQAFAAQRQQMPNVRLFLVGAALFTAENQAYAGQLQQFLAQHNLTPQVTWLGARQDVPALLNAMDMVALNSSVEPFGLAVAEALATGIPAVAPALDGFLEIIDDQQTGLLGSPEDASTLVAAIHRLARDPALRQQMGAEGRRRMIERFPQSKLVTAHEDLYRRTLAQFSREPRA